LLVVDAGYRLLDFSLYVMNFVKYTCKLHQMQVINGVFHVCALELKSECPKAVETNRNSVDGPDVCRDSMFH